MKAWRNARCSEAGSVSRIALGALLVVGALGACESETHDDDAGDRNLDASSNPAQESPSPGRDAASPNDGASSPASDTREAGSADAASTRSDAGTSMNRDAQTMAMSDASTMMPATAGIPTLFFLDITGERVLRADPSARTATAVVTRGSASPDGIAVDPIKGALYWTNMGVPESNDGFLMRADLNGANAATVVPKAATFTPKQLHLDVNNGLLYWSDREGMRVMRAHTDGSNVETLVTTGSGDAARADAANWAVGIGVDLEGGKLYWTQKGPDNGNKGSIRRAKLEPTPGEDSAHRSDIEILFAGLPEPVDLDLDLVHRQIYWTDRGDNTVSRAAMDPPAGVAPDKRSDRAILVRNAGEAIGIALDVAHDAIYYTSLEGNVSQAKLDGTSVSVLLKNQGSLTGIAYVELPR